jgi:hypothetical protein
VVYLQTLKKEYLKIRDCKSPARQISSAGPFDLVALFFQFGNQKVTMIALNFDISVLQSATGSAPAFQFTGQILQFSPIEWNAGDDRNRFASSALAFPLDPDNSVTCRVRSTFAADTAGFGLSAIRADASQF